MERRSNAMLAATLSVAAIPGVPALIVAVMFAAHAVTFDGTCGPYPMDIPAYPCGFAEYLAGFFEPFAAAWLLVISIAIALGTAVVIAVGWVVAAIVVAVQQRRALT